MKNSTPIAAEPTTVYNLPPSMRPVPSQAVESFRAAHPAPIPSSIAAALCAAEAFIDAAQARPIGEYDEWPAQLYKNALAMISFAEWKNRVASFDVRDSESAMFANQLADFWRFSATIRALLQQIKADVDRVWLEYETEKWPALTEQ